MKNQSLLLPVDRYEAQTPTYDEALVGLKSANERVKAALVHMLNATDAEVRAHRAQVLSNAISELARAAYVFQGAAFEAAQAKE